jgi:hypothetical protein
VFGKRDGATIDLQHLGAGGFQITRTAGQQVSAAGDVNGDGLADVVTYGSGSAIIVYGSPSTATVGGTSPGAAGFSFKLKPQSPEIIASVAGAGDINGDGLADVVFGLTNMLDPLARGFCGRIVRLARATVCRRR